MENKNTLLQEIVLDLCIIICIVSGVHFVGKLIHPEVQTIVTYQVDTVRVVDTVTIYQPITKYRDIIKRERIEVHDTTRINDTLFLYLDRERIVWEDSYSTVHVSGIHTTVDSVIHRLPTTYINNEIVKTVTKKPRFSVGIQGGVGVTGNGLHPYVGVGVTYNLFSF